MEEEDRASPDVESTQKWASKRGQHAKDPPPKKGIQIIIKPTNEIWAKLQPKTVFINHRAAFEIVPQSPTIPSSSQRSKIWFDDPQQSLREDRSESPKYNRGISSKFI